MTETFWVVERFENGKSAGYWDGANSRSFVSDIEKAGQQYTCLISRGDV